MLPFFLIFCTAVAIIAFILLKPRYRDYQRNKAASTPFKKEWRKVIQRRMPYFKSMPADLQLQLERHILIFLAEKRFIGCNGIVINDEIRLTVAAQACLLLLNRKTDYYPKLKTILIYPRAFVKTHANTNADGVQSVVNTTLAGESWSYGSVVLSWQDTLQGADIPDDGHNVVIHEFAHQIDQEDGEANGAPPLHAHQSYEQWSSILSKEFASLQAQAQTGVPSIFDYYGATNPAEFFAVSSEVFFEKAHEFKAQHPAMYAQLKEFYQVDPSLW